MIKFCPDGKKQFGFKSGDNWATPNFTIGLVDYVDPYDGDLNLDSLYFLDKSGDEPISIMMDITTGNLLLKQTVINGISFPATISFTS